MKREYRPDKLRKRCEHWEKDRTDKGSECAKAIRQEIERLSPFKVNSIGTEVETGYVEGLIPKSEHLDYEITLNGKRIAEIDVTGSNYTFGDSKIMPVNFYKGEKTKKLGLQTFMVFSMERENLPLKDRCVWIKGADVIKCNHRAAWLGGKIQDNYYTNKEDWKRGLETLIAELQKPAPEKNRQTQLA